MAVRDLDALLFWMRPCVDLMYLCVPMRLRSEGSVSWMCVCSDTPRFRAGVGYVGTPLLQRLCIRTLCYLRCSDALITLGMRLCSEAALFRSGGFANLE